MYTVYRFIVAWLTPLIIVSCGSDFGEENARPNVIIIMTDDQGYGDMSCNGNPYIETPAIDEIYQTSLVLENFHVDPTCAPTRAALMTGKYSARVGVWMTYMGRHHLKMEEQTMADIFQENGYETAIFGKWHLGDNYPFRPSDRGFKESLVHGGGVIGETPDHWGNDYYDDVYLRNNTPEKQIGYCTDVWFKEAQKFVENSKDKPFFLYLTPNAPHGPLNVPYEYVKPFLNKPGISEERAWFYGMLANIDQNLRAFRTFLKESGLSENTVLIFMTDNGTRHGYTEKDSSGFNAGMRALKGSPYEGGHRVPCMIHWPSGDLDKHRKVNKLTAHFDLLPTLIDMLGLSADQMPAFDGVSLKPLIYKETATWPDRKLIVQNQITFGEKLVNDLPVKYKKFVVMDERWRMVGDELFDITDDTRQRNDVSAKYPEVREQLSEFYDEWWEALEPSFDEYNSTIIGSEAQNQVTLSSQFWHGDHVPYNQQHVRNGMNANGFWDIDIAKSGHYEVTLSRWPQELDLAINEVVPKPEPDTTRFFRDDKLRNLPSKELHFQLARLKVGQFDQTIGINPGDKEVAFEVHLEKGKHFLKSWLIDEQMDSVGAYYVSMRLLD